MSDLTPPRRRPFWPVLALVLAAAGLGAAVALFLLDRDPAAQTPVAPATPTEASPSQAATLPKCGDIFRPGQVIDPTSAPDGCTGPTGTAHAGLYHECTDGRRLYTIDAAMGAPAGWGLTGDVYHAVADAAGDPDFARAYKECQP